MVDLNHFTFGHSIDYSAWNQFPMFSSCSSSIANRETFMPSSSLGLSGSQSTFCSIMITRLTIGLTAPICQQLEDILFFGNPK